MNGFYILHEKQEYQFFGWIICFAKLSVDLVDRHDKVIECVIQYLGTESFYKGFRKLSEYKEIRKFIKFLDIVLVESGVDKRSRFHWTVTEFIRRQNKLFTIDVKRFHHWNSHSISRHAKK